MGHIQRQRPLDLTQSRQRSGHSGWQPRVKGKILGEYAVRHEIHPVATVSPRSEHDYLLTKPACVSDTLPQALVRILLLPPASGGGMEGVVSWGRRNAPAAGDEAGAVRAGRRGLIDGMCGSGR